LARAAHNALQQKTFTFKKVFYTLFGQIQLKKEEKKKH
jgi:hypothetical protein